MHALITQDLSSHGTDNGSMHQSCSWTLQQHGMRAGLRIHTRLSVGIHAYGQWISLHCGLGRRETKLAVSSLQGIQ